MTRSTSTALDSIGCDTRATGRVGPAAAATFEGYLEGLRGIAILIVLFGHASNVGLHIVPGLDAAGSEKYGVWLFFALSAYLLTPKLLGPVRNRSLRAVGSYFVGRVARIYPLYLCVILGYVAWGRMTLGEACEHLMLVRGDDVFWAIPAECGYYVLLPLVVWLYVLACRERLAAFVALSAATSWGVALRYPPSLASINSILPWPYLTTFLAGSCAALVARHGLPRAPAAGLLCTLAVLLLATLLPGPFNSIRHILGYAPWSFERVQTFSPAVGLLWAVVVLAAGRSHDWNRWLSNSLLRFVGRISFSLYLLHMPVLELAYHVPQRLLPGAAKGTAFLAAASLVASLTYAAIERPGMQAGRRLRTWLTTR